MPELSESSRQMKSNVVHTDPDVMHGTPVFLGTRVPIGTLWDYLEAGESLKDFLVDFPSVSRKQAEALIRQARHALSAQDGPEQGRVACE